MIRIDWINVFRVQQGRIIVTQNIDFSMVTFLKVPRLKSSQLFVNYDFSQWVAISFQVLILFNLKRREITRQVSRKKQEGRKSMNVAQDRAA